MRTNNYGRFNLIRQLRLLYPKSAACCKTVSNVYDCRMNTLTITLGEEAAQLVRKAAESVNQPVEDWVRESICKAAARAVNTQECGTRRIAPLHPDAMNPAHDFNASTEEFQRYI